MVLDFNMGKFVNNDIIYFKIGGHDESETEKNLVIGSTRTIAGLGAADSDFFRIKLQLSAVKIDPFSKYFTGPFFVPLYKDVSGFCRAITIKEEGAM